VWAGCLCFWLVLSRSGDFSRCSGTKAMEVETTSEVLTQRKQAFL
jgi:hypothetical protein